MKIYLVTKIFGDSASFLTKLTKDKRARWAPASWSRRKTTEKQRSSRITGRGTLHNNDLKGSSCIGESLIDILRVSLMSVVIELVRAAFPLIGAQTNDRSRIVGDPEVIQIGTCG